MKPIKKTVHQGNFFTPWLVTSLNPSNELYQLAKQINWKFLEDEFESLFVADKGAPVKPVRLVVGIMMLQNMCNFSEEGAVEQWIQNPYWQFFCGEKQMQWERPIDPSSLPRWRKRIGKEGMNKILGETIKTALSTGTIKKKAWIKRLSTQL